MKGVQLEDQGGTGTAMSHWEKRILGVSYDLVIYSLRSQSYKCNEFVHNIHDTFMHRMRIMTGIVDDNTVLSRITLALMEDSGSVNEVLILHCYYCSFPIRWYLANYKYAEYLYWGDNVGCTLPSKSCYEYFGERWQM